MTVDVDTGHVQHWRSIITLIVFCIANVLVLFPFHIPIYIPTILINTGLSILERLHITSPRPRHSESWTLTHFPINFVTAPLVADLFLLAILEIGRQEVHDGTVGVDNIAPIDIMVFFFTLAYIAISIDASGLIRYLAFKTVFYLFALFFGLSAIVGNDPVILSGTAFLAYMTRAARNIVDPRAWIYAQFAVVNVGSAIFVSSNPANLVLAGAFDIRFIEYTANMVVPVVLTVLVLCPALYLIFYDRQHSFIPPTVQMDELSTEDREKPPTNPNLPRPHEETEIPLEEILNPYLDKWSAGFGTILICTTLVVVLVVNATSDGAHPVFWVTLPAAVIMFSWDLGHGWHRHSLPGSEAKSPRTIESMTISFWNWSRATFPTATTVLSLLPYALLPFSLAMFVLVQALVTKGWVAVFAHGWKAWIDATGTVGAIGGMGFIAVILCNFAGTNIGTTILLCRVLQAWVEIERRRTTDGISQRTFWATVYGMAIGVNYGAFSVAFSASLAGMLWRDILRRKHLHIRGRDFARNNIPIIAVCMVVGCAVLVGEVYITRS